MLENFTYDGKKRFYFCIRGNPLGQKNIPPPSPKNHLESSANPT